MQAPLEVSFKNMEPSPAIVDDIEQRVAKLDRYFEKVTSCHVTVEAPHKHHRKGRHWRVRILINAPGRQLVVSDEPGNVHAHEDLGVALRDAFNAAVRQLQDYARTLRGDVKAHEPAQNEGRVARLFADDGYGFIDAGPLGEVYFHQNSVVDGRFAELEAGSRVSFVIAEGESEHGAQASTVHPLR
jgi:ribosomal subunit interface protein